MVHERMVEYVHNLIEQVKTFSQSNFCMAQNHDLKHCTVEELSALVRNGNNTENLALVQRIYKCTANITGSNPF